MKMVGWLVGYGYPLFGIHSFIHNLSIIPICKMTYILCIWVMITKVWYGSKNVHACSLLVSEMYGELLVGARNVLVGASLFCFCMVLLFSELHLLAVADLFAITTLWWIFLLDGWMDGLCHWPSFVR